jgi:hypothetical protein
MRGWLAFAIVVWPLVAVALVVLVPSVRASVVGPGLVMLVIGGAALLGRVLRD